MKPKIRFAGYNGDWTKQKMQGHLHFLPGFPFSSSFFSDKVIGKRLIRNRDLHSSDEITYTDECCPDRYIVKDGDLLVGMDGDFTPCTWEQEDALLNQRVGKITCDTEWDLRFIEYLLGKPLADMQKSTGATTVKHLTHSGVLSIESPSK